MKKAAYWSYILFSHSICSSYDINGPLDVYLDFLWKHLYFVVTVLFFDYNPVCARQVKIPKSLSSLSTLSAGPLEYDINIFVAA